MSSWQRRQITRVLRRRLAISCIHGGFPRRPGLLRSASLRTWWTSRPPCPRRFAAPGEEPVDQLVALGAGHDGPLVGEDGCAHPPEGDPAEAGDQWLPAPVALGDPLQALARPGGGVDGRLVLAGHLPDRRAVLARQGLEQRGLHDPVQAAQAEHVLGQQVVLDEPAYSDWYFATIVKSSSWSSMPRWAGFPLFM